MPQPAVQRRMKEPLSITGGETNNQAEGRVAEKDRAVNILLTQPLEAGPHRSRSRIIYEVQRNYSCVLMFNASKEEMHIKYCRVARLQVQLKYKLLCLFHALQFLQSAMSSDPRFALLAITTII